MRDIDKYESKNQTLQRQLAAVEKEVAEVTHLKTELEGSINNANKEVCRLQDILKEKERWCQNEMDKLRKEMFHSETEWKKQLLTTRAMLTEEQQKTRELECRIVETQENALKHIKVLAEALDKSDDSKEKLLIAQDHIMMLESTITNLQDEKKQSLYNYHAELQRLKHACESCHNDLNLATIEKNEMEKMYDIEKAKAAQLEKALDENECSMAKSEEKQRLLFEERMRLLEKIKDFESDNKFLEQKLEIAAEDMHAVSKELEELKEHASDDRKKAEKLLHSEVRHE